ncbi:hypothetical protein D3C85_911060 [compost metagenome]
MMMMRCMSPAVLAGASRSPAASASWYFRAWARKPILTSGCSSFWKPAVRVQISSQTAGTAVAQAKRSRFILNRTTVPRIRATAASIWLAMPNSGHRLLMPPRGSTTPV